MKNNWPPKLTICLFYLTIILIPFNARYIFNFDQVQFVEEFHENLTWSVYFFDPIFFCLILSFLVSGFLNKKIKFNLKKSLQTPLFWLILLGILNLIVTNEKPPAIYQFARLSVAFIFFFLAKKLLESKQIKLISILLIFISGIFQSIIALGQFVFQKSLGLSVLGESMIAPDILGVAKFEIYGNKIIRSYGTFPHPNLLAIFLLLALGCGWWLWLQENKKIKKKYLAIGLLFISVGIISTYSRGGILASALLLTIFLITNRKLFSTLLNLNKKNFSLFQKILMRLSILLLIFLIFFSTYRVLAPRLCYKCAGENSIELRQIYSYYAQKIIAENRLLGVGLGNFTLTLKKKSNNLANYEIQPVHNLYLLIAAELGILGLILWSLFILKSGLNKPLNKKRIFGNPFSSVFIIFLLLGLIDHYFWTLPQGQLLFFLGLALSEN